MKVGLSYWGYCAKIHECTHANTPDGHRFGRPMLVDDLTDRGHQVIALQARREITKYGSMQYDELGFPDIDVLFVEWRWPTYKNSGEGKFETDLDRQIELLDYYHGKIPIVAWDTDLKMTPEDEKRWPLMIIADPTLEPESFTRKRVRLTFWSNFKSILPASEGSYEFGYIGNNYERDEMFQKYYGNPSLWLRRRGIQTTVHGNWLQKSPERISPDRLIMQYPHIAFGRRVSFFESMQLLNSMIATIHITKPRYARQGFVSPRYLENIALNTPAFVPGEFLVPDLLGENWCVNDSLHVIDRIVKLRYFKQAERELIVKEQKDNLLKVHDFRVSYVSEFLESITDISVHQSHMGC